MKKSLHLLFIVISLLLFTLLRCGRDYNPYENFSNAQIRTISTQNMLKDGDTVSIFTTETLGVFAAVSEKIDRFSIHTDSNIYWTDTFIADPNSKIDYRFLVSFADTGKKSVAITTQRTNGDVFTQSMALYVRSPLFQKDIVAVIGEPCTLSTAPVGDHVYYFWSFGMYRGMEKVVMTPFSNNPGQNIVGVEVGKKLNGYLWVADTLNRFKSPACTFSYRFSDISGPQIISTNKGQRGDTIVTGESNFEFSIHVMDESGDIDSVDLVNGQFDWHSSDRLDYKKYFTDMDAYTSENPNIVMIRAWDMQANVTVDTFYLYYDASGPKADRVKLVLYSPPSQSVSTRLDHILVAIGVENKTGDTLVLRAAVNGQPFPPEKTVPDTAATVMWDITPLSQGTTIATITASAQSTQYAETTLTIERDDSAPDTGKPVSMREAALFP